jgi:hypothetical protein
VLIIANPTLQTQPTQLMQQLGFECVAASDPYAAMAELCINGGSYRGVVVSLQSFYREEIALIGTIRRRFMNVEVWLTHTDGRAAAMAEAMRLGADGLVAEDGLHRIATAQSSEPLSVSKLSNDSIVLPQTTPPTNDASESETDEPSVSEPVLTADELRALLQEQPSMPPSSGSEN